MKSVFQIVVAFCCGAVLAGVIVGYVGNSRATRDSGPMPREADTRIDPVLPVDKSPSTEVKKATSPREELLAKAERQFKDGTGGAEETFRELDQLETREFGERLATDMAFLEQSGLVATVCGLHDIAEARWRRCINHYEMIPGGVPDEIQSRIQQAYVSAARNLLVFQPQQADQFEFWPFAMSQLLRDVPDSAKRAHFTVTGITKQYNQAILILMSSREKSTDPDLQASLDRAISVLESERQEWLRSSVPR